MIVAARWGDKVDLNLEITPFAILKILSDAAEVAGIHRIRFAHRARIGNLAECSFHQSRGSDFLAA
jgi:hypothetical protein